MDRRGRHPSRRKPSPREYGYLKTNKNFKDFEMALRFRCEGDGNSGVFFHTEFKPGTADVSQGLQFEIDQVVAIPAAFYGNGCGNGSSGRRPNSRE